MHLYSIDANKKYNFNKLNNLIKKEKETCQEYAYILTDEFSEWFNKLFDLTKYHGCEFYNYDKENIYRNAIILYDVLYDYISFQEQKDDRKTELTYSISRNIKVNNNIFNLIISNPEHYSPHSAIVGHIFIRTLNDDAEYDLTLKDLQNFVVEQINNRQNTSLIIINEVIKCLEENGINSKDILNALQINYASIANREIEKQTGGRK